MSIKNGLIKDEIVEKEEKEERKEEIIAEVYGVIRIPTKQNEKLIIKE